MIATLHDKLESEGPHVRPRPRRPRSLARRAKRSPLELVGIVAAAAGTLVGLEHLGVVELPIAVLLGGTALLTVSVLVDSFRTKDDDDDD